jgi:hypothetical protein
LCAKGGLGSVEPKTDLVILAKHANKVKMSKISLRICEQQIVKKLYQIYFSPKVFAKIFVSIFVVAKNFSIYFRFRETLRIDFRENFLYCRNFS